MIPLYKMKTLKCTNVFEHDKEKHYGTKDYPATFLFWVPRAEYVCCETIVVNESLKWKQNDYK